MFVDFIMFIPIFISVMIFPIGPPFQMIHAREKVFELSSVPHFSLLMIIPEWDRLEYTDFDHSSPVTSHFLWNKGSMFLSGLDIR